MHYAANPSERGQAHARQGRMVKRTIPISCISLSVLLFGCVPHGADQDERLALQKKYELIQIGSEYRVVSNKIGKGICTTNPGRPRQYYDHFFRRDYKYYQEIKPNIVYTSGVTLGVSNGIISLLSG